MTTPNTIRAAAEKATPGPWDNMPGRNLVRAIRGDLAVPLFEAMEPYSDPLLETPTCRVGKNVVFRANSQGARQSAALRQECHNAAYIAAANPQAVLSLLDQLAEKEADHSILFSELQDLRGRHDALKAEGVRLSGELADALSRAEKGEETLRLVRDRIPMDYLRRHDVPGATRPTPACNVAAAMKDYAEDRWKILDRVTKQRADLEQAEARATQAEGLVHRAEIALDAVAKAADPMREKLRPKLTLDNVWLIVRDCLSALSAVDGGGRGSLASVAPALPAAAQDTAGGWRPLPEFCEDLARALLVIAETEQLRGKTMAYRGEIARMGTVIEIASNMFVLMSTSPPTPSDADHDGIEAER